MADNVNITPGSGATIATENCPVPNGSTAQVQLMKFGFGNADSYTPVNISTGLPVESALDSGQIYAGGVSLAPQFAAIAASTSGDGNVVVAASSGKKIRVLKWTVVASDVVNFKFRTFNGTSTYVDLTGVMNLAGGGCGVGGAFCPIGHFQTQVGQALTLNLSAATAVGGYLVYILV